MINIKKGSRILFIGDSITDIKFNRRFNRELHGKNIYALQVSKQLKKEDKTLKFFYKGIASNRSYHVYDRLTKDCINLKPDVIILLIGVNDAWENYKPEDYGTLNRPIIPHMKEIYRRINTELPNAQTLVLLPFLIDALEEKLPFHKILDEYIEILRKT
ncbi:MAG: GDSL-type esterase/lipase family protein, partial [Clostridiales bacterium]|nr:GDSL-type esterase/lipase family protein [Clostridiales bacterium]